MLISFEDYSNQHDDGSLFACSIRQCSLISRKRLAAFRL